MNILVNISNLRFGGGISVAQNLLRSVIPLRPQDHFFIICPAGCGYESLQQQGNVQLIFVPEAFHRRLTVKYFYNQAVFPSLVRKHRIHKVVSLGNVAFPAGRLPHLLLIQNAWLLYPESVAWKKIDRKSRLRNQWMNAYIAHHLQHATAFAFQTTLMRDQFRKLYKIYKRKPDFIIPNAPVMTDRSTAPPLDPSSRPAVLLMLSKYYAYKNFEILLPLAKLLQASNAAIEIHITIDAGESAEAATFLQQIAAEGLGDIIKNRGHIPQDQVPKAIDSCHGVFLPSLLESYSGVYPEALRMQRLIFTSDLDFARNICGKSAFYFDPADAHNIAEVLLHAFECPELLQQKIEQGRQQYGQMPTWSEIALAFCEIISVLD